MIIPENVKTILMKLNEKGYEAYIVGGAVRDYLLGKEPHDYDITTNARPDEVKAVFGYTIDTGLKHGTVTALIGGGGFEITTYRVDGKYSDGRHPDTIKYADTLKEDLSRRDLTINAMAMDIDGNIIDPFNGLDDLRHGIIRCVGDPDERFKEDALRMLRAIRFEGQLGFNLNKATKEAIERNCFDLIEISDERIREEFTKMLLSDHPKKAFIDVYETGMAGYIFPEFERIMECEHESPYHYASVGIHTLDAVEMTEKDSNLRWSALLHDIGKPVTKTYNVKKGYYNYLGHAEQSRKDAGLVLERLKFSNADRKEILDLIEMHDFTARQNSKVRLFASIYGGDFIEKLGKLKYADSYCHAEQYRDALIAVNKKFIEQALSYIKDGTAIQKKDLKINGNDLKAIGLEGKEIGDCIDELYQLCIKQPEYNTYDKLIRQAKSFQQRLKSDLDKEIEEPDR